MWQDLFVFSSLLIPQYLSGSFREFMRKSVLLSLVFALSRLFSVAQTTDTTIYDVAESLPIPLMARCQLNQHPGWTEDSVRRCAESQLLALMATNIRYPEEARQNNLEGTVVTSFIVEPEGRISGIGILKDIGGGCGAEAVRVLAALDEAGLRWQPATRSGKAVRMRQALPLRFKLQEALPYYISTAGDSIYVQLDTLPNFKGGSDSMESFILNRLEYPALYLDSCRTGIIEMALLIRPSGKVEVDNQLDFNNLGVDFQWQALRLANRMNGLWIPAFYKGQPVITSVPLRVLFKSDQAGCRQINDRFDQAMLLANEAVALAGQNELEKSIAKWDAALALHPSNTEFLYYRGSAYLSLNKRDEACSDFGQIKNILGITWFESLRRLVCGW